MLFGSYRRGDANDPDLYVAAITAVLAGYDTDLIREVTDPRTGIMTVEKYMTFMPNAGELKVYCEGVAARRERIARLGALPKPAPIAGYLAPAEQPAGHLANVHIPATHTRYARLCARLKDSDQRFWKFGKSSVGVDGVWVALSIWQEGDASARNVGAAATMTVDQLRSYYAKPEDAA